MAQDPTPKPMVDQGSARLWLAENARAQAAPPAPPPPTREPDAPEEDAPAARSGVITMASEYAREFRDAVVTKPAGGESPRPPRKGPIYALITILCGAFGFGGMEARLRWSDPVAEITAHSAGRVEELSKQVQAIQAEASRARASDLQRDYDQAMTFRALDGNIASLQDAFQVPASARKKLDGAIEKRHETAIDLYEESMRKAQQRALEATVADHDTVGGP